MRRLQLTSKIILVIGIIFFLLSRFTLSVPDWVVRFIGVILLIAIFALTFSSVRLKNNQEKQIKGRN